MKKQLFFAALAANVAGIVACSGAPTELTEQVESDEAAASLSSTSTYFSVRGDYRRCMAPLCGGYWIKRVNHSTTRCMDGSYSAECYVADIDWSSAGLDPSDASGTGSLVFRGTIGSKNYYGQWTLGVLKATEAWQAATDATASGSFYRVKFDNLVCFRAPCFDTTADELNSRSSRKLSDLDGAYGSKVESIFHKENVIATGSVHTTTNGGRALSVSQFWTQVRHKSSDPLYCNSNSECTVTAYSKQVTSDADCYCARCATTVMNTSTESTNEGSWNKFCSSKPIICPMIMCIKPPTASCVNHTCTKVENL